MDSKKKAASPLYPLLLEPIFKYRIWGGRRLEKLLDKKLPPDQPIGESWETSCRNDDNNLIRNGHLAGRTLADVFKNQREALVGSSLSKSETFPLLNKFIDANDLLSVQVHPNERAAADDPKAEAKTEAWYVVDADPGATLVKGLKPGVSKESFKEAIQNRTVPATLNSVPVSSGDMVFVPAGCVHAMGKGLVICEIQQNSDTTYRVYDWDRTGPDGNPRQLHVEQALRSINFEDRSPDKVSPLTVTDGGNVCKYLVACPYFAMQSFHLKEALQGSPGGRRFESLMVVAGSGVIRTDDGDEIVFSVGDTVLMPACVDDYIIEPKGRCSVLRIFVPDIETDIVRPLRAKGLSDREIQTVIFK